MLEYIKVLVDFADQAEELRPAVKDIFKAINSYGPEVFGLLDNGCKGVVDLKVNMINRFIKKGFTKDEAILLTIDSFHALEKASNKNNINP